MIINDVLLFSATSEETPHEQLLHCWNLYPGTNKQRQFCSGKSQVDSADPFLTLINLAHRAYKQTIKLNLRQVAIPTEFGFLIALTALTAYQSPNV